MKTKMVLLALVTAIIMITAGCTPSILPPQSRGLVIDLGASDDVTRATFSPVFNAQPLTTFGRITVDIVGVGASAGTNRYYESTTAPSSNKVEAADLPYGRYNVTVKAYLPGVGDNNKYSAIATTANFDFTNATPRLALTLKPITSEGTGTFTYKLTDPDTVKGPVTAKLFNYSTNAEYATLTVNNTEIPLNNVPVGYYRLTFGNKVPHIIHIYKDLETKMSDTNDIFDLSINPAMDPKINIQLNRSGKILGGTLITMTLSGQYSPGTVSLNNGTDNGLMGTETLVSTGTYTRTFTMPNRSIVINALLGTPPGVDLGFEDISNYSILELWNGTSTATTASPGQTITIRAVEPAVTLVVKGWYFNDAYEESSSASHLIPNPCSASYIGVFVEINGVPYSLSIKIVQ